MILINSLMLSTILELDTDYNNLIVQHYFKALRL